ncbi:MAG: DNA adenine methylase [Candidatus Symbiobacter sp.]|nr:DNA adenine methylase [Candidatus Symbiobacter sp.]
MAGINSPFRYAGGKFYARKQILSHIPVHSSYIEPFAGGASIFFAKEKVKENWINDIDSELINVYKVIRDFPQQLIEFLKRPINNVCAIPQEFVQDVRVGDMLPASKQLHHYFKNSFSPKNDLERAARWFYLNRTSYSGIMNFQNMYFGYGDKYSMQPKNWPRNILRTSEKLQNVKLTDWDFELVIDQAQDQALVFLDPPYFNADQDKFYNCSFSKQDHFRLEKCINRNQDRLSIFITYDNTPEIKALYSWMPMMFDTEWNYCIQRTDDQKFRSNRKGERYKGQELFLMNYSIESDYARLLV